MVAETVSMADLAASLAEILERVRSGERVAVERDGQVIATLVPGRATPGITLRELAVELARLPPLDDDFGADIEAARANLLPAEAPEWPD